MKISAFSIMMAMLAIILLAGQSYGDAQISATRALPEFVNPDSEFEVTLSVDLDENNPPNIYILYEKIPHGLVLGSVDPFYTSFDENSRKIIWIVSGAGSDLEDQVYTYTLYTSDPGTYAFNGNIAAGEYSASTDGCVVAKVKDNCTESWVCEYWSDCVDGEQTRSCRDLNECLFRVNMPATKQICTMDESESAADDHQESVDEVDVAVESVEEDSRDEDVVEIVGEAGNEAVVENVEEDSGDEDVADDENTEGEEIVDDAEIAHGEMLTDDIIAAGDETGTERDAVSDKEMTGADESTPDGGVPRFTKVLGFILLAEMILLIVRTKRKEQE